MIDKTTPVLPSTSQAIRERLEATRRESAELELAVLRQEQAEQLEAEQRDSLRLDQILVGHLAGAARKEEDERQHLGAPAPRPDAYLRAERLREDRLAEIAREKETARLAEVAREEEAQRLRAEALDEALEFGRVMNPAPGGQRPMETGRQRPFAPEASRPIWASDTACEDLTMSRRRPPHQAFAPPSSGGGGEGRDAAADELRLRDGWLGRPAPASRPSAFARLIQVGRQPRVRRIMAVSLLALAVGIGAVKLAETIATGTIGAGAVAEIGGPKLAVRAAPGQQPRANSLATIKVLQAQGLNLTLMGSLEGQDFLIARSAEGEAQPVLVSPSGHSYLYGGIPFDEKGSPLLLEFFPKATAASPSATLQSSTGAMGGGATGSMATPIAMEPQMTTPPVVVPAAAPPPLPVVRVSAATEDALHALGRVAVISYGETGPDLYVVVDPSCPVCRAVWPALKALADAGTVSLHVVPVGLVNDKSIEHSVGILAAADPARAWDDAMKGVFASGPAGAATPEDLERIDSEALFAAVDLAIGASKKPPEGKANQERWRTDLLSAGIDRLTLNMGDIGRRRLLKYSKLVRLNSQAAISAHVQGTPAFFGHNAAGQPWHFDGEPPNGDVKALLSAAEAVR